MRQLICTCDKCKEEFKPNDLWPIKVAVCSPTDDNYSVFTAKKEYCRKCLYELFPGIVGFGTQPMNQKETQKSTSERFEELIREICREEMEVAE